MSSSLRWYRAMQKYKLPQEIQHSYTNFSLSHAWEKFDSQSQMLCKEAMVPVFELNPELLDIDIERSNVSFFDARDAR
jgi:hypothetical protein